jgi:hypothetical protein
MKATSIFTPQSRSDFKPGLAFGQRYRHSFGDKRLAVRYQELLEQMCSQQSIVVNQLSKHKSEQSGYYRFLSNPKVTPSELIYENSCINSALVEDKDILVIQDQTSIGFRPKLKRKAYWQKQLGVIDDNSTPGFYANCSLLIDRDTCSLLGLGDMVLYNRPLNTLDKQQKRQARTARRKLPLEEQESFAWALGASNCKEQLKGSRRLTFVMDQGSDKYEVLTRILSDATSQAIWRSRENRQVLENGEQTGKRLCDVLKALSWSPARSTLIRALNHYSKTNGKCVQREGRTALIRVRYAKVYLALPSGLTRQTPTLSRPLYVVQATEDPSTVPPGEEPINWRLLTTWQVCSNEQAWLVVEAYQARWFIEQLFRVLKKQGLRIEEMQLKTLQSIKNQTIMAITTSAKAMQLTLARDGNTFTPIETMFDQEQQSILLALNQEYSGKTQKQTNPHDAKSLAWAAWVIARMGGWKGYASQRPPGPITMKRGLEHFDKIVWATRVLGKRKDMLEP